MSYSAQGSGAQGNSAKDSPNPLLPTKNESNFYLETGHHDATKKPGQF